MLVKIADLQFSSEDEFDEVPDEHMEGIDLAEPREVSEVVPAEDDSQQAAEAMVQLGNVGYYVGDQQLLQHGKYRVSIGNLSIN